MKLFKLSQDENNSWDTYDSCIVAAEDEKQASYIHPCEWSSDPWGQHRYREWASSPTNVKVEYIGEAAEGVEEGVILSSFNAG